MKRIFHKSILRAYDIRGVVGETLNTEDAYALGTNFLAMQERKIKYQELL